MLTGQDFINAVNTLGDDAITDGQVLAEYVVAQRHDIALEELWDAPLAKYFKEVSGILAEIEPVPTTDNPDGSLTVNGRLIHAPRMRDLRLVEADANEHAILVSMTAKCAGMPVNDLLALPLAEFLPIYNFVVGKAGESGMNIP